VTKKTWQESLRENIRKAMLDVSLRPTPGVTIHNGTMTFSREWLAGRMTNQDLHESLHRAQNPSEKKRLWNIAEDAAVNAMIATRFPEMLPGFEVVPCKDCNTSSDVTLAPCPYAQDIHGDETPVYMCGDCRDNAVRDT
jgi:hypothetical protein